MRFLSILAFATLAIFTQNLSAQNELLAQHQNDSHEFERPSVDIEDYYQALMEKYGPNDRYRACELALQRFDCEENEYHAKLYNTLAEEALLMRDYAQAKDYYHKTLGGNFKANYYTQGLLVEREQLGALAGLRNVAMQEEEYDTALVYHQRYVDSLQANWRELAQRNQLNNDKIFATCYQRMGKSEKAIEYLTPYTFGTSVGFYGVIDKQAIDYLTELLRTKYPKKAYKRFLNEVANNIYSEQKDGKVHFYLQVLENKIYFQNDSANYMYRVAEDETLMGQAIAHYQRKLLNSYFYQSLFR